MTEPVTHANNYTDSSRGVLPSRVLHALNDLQAGIELKAARVAAGQEPTDDLERDFKGVLDRNRSAAADRGTTLQARMAAPLRLYRTSSRYRAYAGVDPLKAGAVDSVDLVALHRSRVAPLADSWVHIPTAVDGLADLQGGIVVPQASHTALRFYIAKIKCIKETPWDQGSASDEIYVGANFIDETGDVTKASWFQAVPNSGGPGFDTGEVADYGFPGKLMQTFGITEAGNKFPKLYTAAVSMVEEDWGNIASWFADLHQKVKDKVAEFLKKQGYQVGERIGLGALGSLIGELFVKVYDWFVKLLMSWFGNDDLGTFKSMVTINSYTGNWIGSGTPFFTAAQSLTGDGANYQVTYRWELV
ncbi:MAG TPA: hypothetical protein VFV67_00920 [Actinophytocola sp.]|uniref:hypothetical protein n=1 Tax=Actinophytocola sp. TaxID=1872138 RepID=UPI002DC03AFE|nr:hypothetical protein [Actinophytocola sp.]HEU5469185.1 hypothetical protein [Actinophytocola sp.]